MFPDEKFDFVYSYAVFQHIPSRDVVFQYLREARRVLKTGRHPALPDQRAAAARAKQYDTWSGVRISRRRDHGSSRASTICNCSRWSRSGRSTCGSPAASRPAGWSEWLTAGREPVLPAASLESAASATR